MDQIITFLSRIEVIIAILAIILILIIYLIVHKVKLNGYKKVIEKKLSIPVTCYLYSIIDEKFIKIIWFKLKKYIY